MKYINHKHISKFFFQELTRLGCSKKTATSVIDALINASLMGIDSHGVNLFQTYVKNLQDKRILTLDKISKVKKKIFSLLMQRIIFHFNQHK